jgi:transcriptional regulator with XRE-family HTH domain
MTPKNKEQVRKEVGEKVRVAREKARLTQKEVATLAGINPSYYAQIERGEVNTSIDKLQDIAEVLKIKTLDILS